MSRPQQNEIRRSERGKLEQESLHRKAEAEKRPADGRPTGPVPEGNRPGRRQTWTCTNCGFHVPEAEQRCPRCGADLPGE
ncbi:MAG TPA: zinc-ribbon domain-containing protein [Actinomycetota bacterium]|nr:zinc-ribbon domain-containing protein [Actinomycetota bacterium]